MSNNDSLREPHPPAPPSEGAVSPRSRIPGLGSLGSLGDRKASLREPEVAEADAEDLAARPAEDGGEETALASGHSSPLSSPGEAGPESEITGLSAVRRSGASPAGPAEKDQGDDVGGRGVVMSRRPDRFDEDEYPFVAPDHEVPFYVLLADEARAGKAKGAKLEDDAAKDIDPIGPRVMTSTPTASAHSTLTSPPLSAHSEDDPDPDSDSDSDGERPTTGIERPVQKPGKPKAFVIARLIENTDKKGNNIRSAIRLRTHYFDVDFGDFLLDLSGARTEHAHVRNYAGQERYVPRRMLQSIYQPWDISARTKVTGDGVPLPLAFLGGRKTVEESRGTVAFESEEPVMIMDELDGNDDQQVMVTDWERKAGRFDLAHLDRKFDRPWGVLIDADALRAAWGKKAAPKLPKAKEAGKGTKRKRETETETAGEEDADADDQVDDGDGAEERQRKKGKGKQTQEKKSAKKAKKPKRGDFIANDEPAQAPSPAPAAITQKPAGKRPAKKPKLSNAVAVADEDEDEDEAGERTEATAGKKPAGKKPAGRKPAGKGPSKKPTSSKKPTRSTEQVLQEAVAEEEESADEDAAYL